jgi:hypothetical protein
MTSSIPRFKQVVKRPHRIYKHSDIDDNLLYLTNSELPRGAIATIAMDTGIPRQTISDWHHHRISPGGEEWFPLDSGHPNKSIFNEIQERAITDYVKENLINPGFGPTRADIATAATNAYSSQDIGSFRTERFSASNKFVDGFMHRNHISLRAPHMERRCNIDSAYVKTFQERLNDCRADYPPERVYNFDETCWKIYYGPRRVLSEKGSNSVKIKSFTGEKQSVTAFGAISASGEKLPLWIVTRGKTERVPKKFGDHPDVVLRYSVSGLATELLIVDYLTWLSDRIGGEPCLLVWTCTQHIAQNL